jgi:hypothetical protein
MGATTVGLAPRLRAVTAIVLIAATLAAPVDLAAAPEPADGELHIRAANPRLRGAVEHGRRHSRTFAGLVLALDLSDVFVDLHDGSCDSQTQSCLRLASTRADRRILRVDVQLAGSGRNRSIEHYDQLVAQIAHELQHAVEIASDASVVDERTLSACFQRLGRSRRTPRGTVYETEAAQRVGRRVMEELRGLRWSE